MNKIKIKRYSKKNYKRRIQNMFTITRPPMYDETAVKPMRDELLAVGFEELRNADVVEKTLTVNDDKTILVVINSVCGCAAGSARPGVAAALQHSIIPDKLTTVFAGQDHDAVDKVRQLIVGEASSSPSMAIFKNGKVVFFLPRFEIEGYSPEQIANKLTEAFDTICCRQGPSVPKEQYEAVQYAKACGSKIPAHP